MGLGKYIQFKLIYKPNLNKRSNFFPFIMVRPKTLTLSCPLLLTTLSLDRFLFSTFLFQLNSLLHYRQWQIHRQECKARHWSKYYPLSFLFVTPLPLKLNFIIISCDENLFLIIFCLLLLCLLSKIDIGILILDHCFNCFQEPNNSLVHTLIKAIQDSNLAIMATENEEADLWKFFPTKNYRTLCQAQDTISSIIEILLKVLVSSSLSLSLLFVLHSKKA